MSFQTANSTHLGIINLQPLQQQHWSTNSRLLSRYQTPCRDRVNWLISGQSSSIKQHELITLHGFCSWCVQVQESYTVAIAKFVHWSVCIERGFCKLPVSRGIFRPSSDDVKHAPLISSFIGIIIIIIIKNEKIRVTLCENAVGALFIVNKICVDGLRNVHQHIGIYSVTGGKSKKK